MVDNETKNRSRRIFSKIKQYKTIVGNFISLGVLQIMRYIVPLLVLPFISRIIGVVHFGEIAIATGLGMFVQTVVNYGFEYMGPRDVARHSDDKTEISRIFSNVIWGRLLIFIIASLLLIMLVLVVPSFREIKLLVFFTAITTLFSIFSPDWLFQGLQKMHYITLVNVVSRIFFVLFVFCFIRKESDYYLYVAFNALGFLMSAIASTYIISKEGIKLLKPSVIGVKKYIENGWDIFVNQICICIYQNLPEVFIGALVGSHASGIYNSGSKLAICGEHSVDVITRTFYPYLSKNSQKHSVYAKLSMAFSVIICLLLIVLAPILFKIFYSQDFIGGVVVLRILALTTIFTNISSIYGVNYLFLVGKEKSVRNVNIICSLIGMAVFCLVINIWGFIGGAIVILCVKIIIALSLFIIVKRMRKVGYEK